MSIKHTVKLVGITERESRLAKRLAAQLRGIGHTVTYCTKRDVYGARVAPVDLIIGRASILVRLPGHPLRVDCALWAQSNPGAFVQYGLGDITALLEHIARVNRAVTGAHWSFAAD